MSHQSSTWDHQRMRHSWEIVQEMKKKYGRKEGDNNKESGKVGDDYATYVTQLPAAILMNGFGQALAQLRAAAKQKEEDPHELLYRHVQDWLCQDAPQAPYRGEKDLLAAIMTHDRKRYNWAVHETMTWLKWHKKFSDTYLKIRKEESEDEESKETEASKAES